MEIRVQAGGLQGLQSVVDGGDRSRIEDIHDLLERAKAAFGSLDALPYDRIVQAISAYQGRERRKRN